SLPSSSAPERSGASPSLASPSTRSARHVGVLGADALGTPLAAGLGADTLATTDAATLLASG
ncbi:MAG TPA: hypothetical protein VEQ58_09850, partial [Polyangiaceae bacterium]|nr:hypothetical protein [Polyangiaceae bacterium]